METNYEHFFGNAQKAARSISDLVDYCEEVNSDKPRKGMSEFTDHFEYGADCDYGLVHTGTLYRWLEKEYISPKPEGYSLNPREALRATSFSFECPFCGGEDLDYLLDLRTCVR